jgi:DNA-binding MarR family transcriptional regulator
MRSPKLSSINERTRPRELDASHVSLISGLVRHACRRLLRLTRMHARPGAVRASNKRAMKDLNDSVKSARGGVATRQTGLDRSVFGVHIHACDMGTGLDLSTCKDCHCLAARRRARAITRVFEEKLRPYGLRATQFSILAALALKGPTPISELADLLGVERTTLTRSAAVLERNGWVNFAPTEDAREHPLRLTRIGRAKLERAFPAWKQAQEMTG